MIETVKSSCRTDRSRWALGQCQGRPHPLPEYSGTHTVSRFHAVHTALSPQATCPTKTETLSMDTKSSKEVMKGAGHYSVLARVSSGKSKAPGVGSGERREAGSAHHCRGAPPITPRESLPLGSYITAVPRGEPVGSGPRWP